MSQRGSCSDRSLKTKYAKSWTQWQGRNDTRLGDYAGVLFRNETIPATLNDAMPIMELGSTPPIVKDYMDTESKGLCYTYSSM